MKAALLVQVNEDVVIDDVHVDRPGPKEVLVRTVACGVCHSDHNVKTTGYRGQPLQAPMVLGHEAAGVVEEVGSEVTYVKPGDQVSMSSSAPCGACRWCMRGQPQQCENSAKSHSRPDGPPRLSYNGNRVDQLVGIAGFAEQMLVHERSLVKLPPEMPLDRAALLGCGGLTGLGAALHAARVEPGDTVAVIGCGGVGLNVIQGARLAGASRIIAVDQVRSKLDLANVFGATDVVDASATDSVEAVLELSGGGVRHAIEVVGLAATIEQAFAMLDTRGTATVVGVARPNVEAKFKATELLFREKRLQGALRGSGHFRLDIPLYCQLYLDGRLKLDELISERMPLDGVNDALKQFDNPMVEVARAVVTF